MLLTTTKPADRDDDLITSFALNFSPREDEDLADDDDEAFDDEAEDEDDLRLARLSDDSGEIDPDDDDHLPDEELQ